jgi:endonuclease-8
LIGVQLVRPRGRWPASQPPVSIAAAAAAMPEGDTIFRAARTLHRALAGKPVVQFESVFPALTRVHVDNPLTNQTVEAVSAVGKHLLMRFSGGVVLRTHMRMNGSWHIYRPGERWQRSRCDMRIVIATADYVAVGFNIPVAEFISDRKVETHQELARLGPDLLSTSFDEEAALRRIRSRPGDLIADVLLNQRVMAGIGNVYKSEVLFTCGINPFTPVESLDDHALRCLIATARRYLVVNVETSLPPMTTHGGFRRTTRRDNPSERLWVYGRAGRPCRRCGTAIELKKHGPSARLTYWCPTCQRQTEKGEAKRE